MVVIMENREIEVPGSEPEGKDAGQEKKEDEEEEEGGKGE